MDDSLELKSLTQRKIIHFDMDAFYASVELKERPDLVNKPVVIGGSPQSRGVVCTANYIARQFGIRSAMPCAHAYRLCPETVFLPPDFKKYRAASQEVHKIFRQFTDLIEPLSLDEAYLDVTEDAKGRFASEIARQIQNAIWQSTKLTGSAGVAPNKMVAKIASDFRKPFGITVIQPHEVKDFIGKLSLRTIPGIGPASQEKLSKLGFKNCNDLWEFDKYRLCELLGENMGSWLYWRSRGVDNRSVEAKRERKSIGLERTFAKDIANAEEITQILALQVDELMNTLAQKKLEAASYTLKVKYSDFTLSTRSETPKIIPRDSEIMLELFKRLLEKTEIGQRKIRLLGVSASKFTQSSSRSVTPLFG